MPLLRTLLLIILFGFSSTVVAQTSERKSFAFLNVANHARTASLGGHNVSLNNKDINSFFNNPAMLGDSLAGFASANYQFYVADIGQATISYAHKFPTLGTLFLGIQHLDYGKINQYDASGQSLGESRSGETALVIGKTHQVSNFRLGMNFKLAFSNIAGFRASALMTDIGGLFIHPKQDFTVGLTIRNLGWVLSEYSETSTSTLPFDVQLGSSFKPAHMPVRFSITAYNLVTPHNTYVNPLDTGPAPGTLDKVLRHVTFGAEVIVHRNVSLMAGYNHLVHQELKLSDSGGGAGISFGFSAQIKSFAFVFSRSTYVVGNAGYAFTVAKNIDNMMKRR